jgi:nitrite reductase (NADH) large subunit
MQALPMAAMQAVTHRARYRLWPVLRAASVIGTVGVIVLDLIRPSLGLLLFWSGLIAYLPLLFLVAPGVWRNICPMATLNGLPRRVGKGGRRRLSAKAQRRAPFIAVALFFLLVPLRAAGLDRDGHALALFMVLLLGAAFAGGMLIAGKAGWCSQICPMLAVERLYGMSPLVVVSDTHCSPCVGCARNCYDLQPTSSALVELGQKNNSAGYARLLFAGAMPWFCVAFFTQPHLGRLTIIGLLAVYLRLGVLALGGAAVALLLDRYGPCSRYQVIVSHAASAVSIYYLFVMHATLTSLHLHALPFGWTAYAMVFVVSVPWLWRALAREKSFRGGKSLARRPSPRAA